MFEYFLILNKAPTSVSLPVAEDRIVPNTIRKFHTLLTRTHDDMVVTFMPSSINHKKQNMTSYQDKSKAKNLSITISGKPQSLLTD